MKVMKGHVEKKIKCRYFFSNVIIFVKDGKLGSYQVLRVVWGRELWVGTHIVMNDPLPD